MLKQLAICTCLALSPLPALAQGENSDLSEGAELLSEGTKMILRGLLEKLEPAAEGWSQLVEMLNDFTLYHAPEMLPNGDIIIRRKIPLVVEPDSGGDIDL